MFVIVFIMDGSSTVFAYEHNDENTGSQSAEIQYDNIAVDLTNQVSADSYGGDNNGLGVFQEIAPSLEFNVDYRYIDAKKLTGDDFTNNVDVTAKGLGMGVTYKF